MKITRVETVQTPKLGHLVWVRIHTEEGLVGLGETYLSPEPVQALIEQVFAPSFLLGQDALEIEAHWRSMFARCSFAGWSGAEMRAISAIDIALWDLLGQASGQPIYQLLGGRCRERIDIYNTCGSYRNLNFNTNADEYARYLLDKGIRTMKIWPFDSFAPQTGGQRISSTDLRQALEPVRKVRAAVGMEMDLAIEFHCHWSLHAAATIAQTLEEFDVIWLEDMMLPDNLDSYQHLSQATRLPLLVSERLMTRYQYLPLMQRAIARIICLDVEWCGGITEGRKIATMAEAYQLPVALHNYGGPVLNFASAHVAASIPNLMFLETGANLLEAWTPEVVSTPVPVSGGHMELPTGPGLGMALTEEFLRRDDVIVRAVT
jgi:galactonate dehydratase